MKGILFIIIACVLGTNALAQGTEDHVGYTTTGDLSSASTTNPSIYTRPAWYKNLEKYWFYRYRLINDFLLIGDGAGKSIPAQSRDMWQEVVFGNGLVPIVGQGNLLNWRDATIDLGHYLLVLSTEYEILKENGFNTDSTERELGYAQSALNRITANAHTYEYLSNNNHDNIHGYPGDPGTGGYYPDYGHVSSCLGGYFIRDDVPYLDFVHNNYSHFNRKKLVSNLSPITNIEEVRYTNCASYVGRYDGPNPLAGGLITDPALTYQPYLGPPWSTGSTTVPVLPVQESQDQLVDLYLGEHFVQKYGPTYLADQSKEFLCKSIKYATNNISCSIHDILYPEICVYGVSPSSPNCWDGGANFFPSAPAAVPAVGISVADGSCNFGINAVYGELPLWVLVMEYSQFKNLNCNQPWRDLYFPDAFNAISKRYSFIPFTTGSISALVDGLSSGLLPTSLGISSWWYAAAGVAIDLTSYYTGLFGTPVTWHTIKKHAGQNSNSYPNLPLIFELEHGDHNWYMAGPGSAFEELLSEAPPCGTYNYYGSSASYYPWSDTAISAYYPSIPPAPLNWTSNDLFSEPYHRHLVGGCSDGAGGAHSDYNGLDYMELFNLYSLEQSYLHGMFNPLYCDNFAVHFPDANGYGSPALPLKLNFLQHISAQNNIADNGWLVLQGTHQVDWNPGFNAAFGCVHQSQIMDYGCHGGFRNDGEYNFADLYPAYNTTDNMWHRGVRPADSASSKDPRSTHQWQPIAYLPNGPGFNRPPLPTPDPREDLGDSLMNDTMVYNMSKALYKLAIFLDTSTTEDVKRDAIQYLGLLDEYDAFKKVYNAYLSSRLVLNLHPNPTAEQAELTYKLPEAATVTLRLTDPVGSDLSQLIGPYEHQAAAGEHKVQIDLTNMPPGIYYLTLSTGNNTTTQKLIKQ